MILCENNLCMNFAAKYLSKDNPQSSNSKQYLSCEMCGNKTEIDNETSREILSMVLKNLNLNPNLLNINNQNMNNNNNISENINPNININNSNNMNNNEKICLLIWIILIIINNNNNYHNNNYHNNNLLITNSRILNQINLGIEHGEPIFYLCLDCMSKYICSKCIVMAFIIIMMY